MQRLKIFLFMLGAFANVGYALFAPFYPKIAHMDYNLTMLEVGMIVGSYYVPLVFGSIPLSMVVHHNRTAAVFIGGGLQGLACIAFGFTTFIPNARGSTFFIISLFLRIVQGLGYTLQGIGIFSVAANLFKSELLSLLGSYEAIGGFSSMVGPILGGFLYEYIGFTYTFVLNGGILFLFTLGVMFSLPRQTGFQTALLEESESYESEKQNDQGSLRVFAVLILNVCIWSIFGFFETDCALFLKEEFNLTTIDIGLYFFIFPAAYSLGTWSVQFFGSTDISHSIPRLILVFSSLACGAGVLMTSCTPKFGFHMNLIQVCLSTALVGFASGIAVLESFVELIASMDNQSDIASGLIKTTNGFGVIVGSYFFGGYMVDRFGFQDTCLYYSSFLCLAGVIYGLATLQFSISEKHSGFKYKTSIIN